MKVHKSDRLPNGYLGFDTRCGQSAMARDYAEDWHKVTCKKCLKKRPKPKKRGRK